MSKQMKLSDEVFEMFSDVQTTGVPSAQFMRALVRDLEARLEAAELTGTLLKAQNTVLLKQERAARIEELEIVRHALTNAEAHELSRIEDMVIHRIEQLKGKAK